MQRRIDSTPSDLLARSRRLDPASAGPLPGGSLSGPELREKDTNLLGVLVLAAAVLVGACGKKGEPQPPIRYTPARTDDLILEQQGNVVTLSLGYPQTTSWGGVLPGLAAVEIWTLQVPQGVDLEALSPQSFARDAENVLTLEGAELESSISGDRIETRLPLETTEAIESIVFATRTASTTGEISEFSNYVPLAIAPPPPPPTTLTVEGADRGVWIRWDRGANDVAGFHVYRRTANLRLYGVPLAFLNSDASELLDETASFGERYIYTVRAVGSRDPLIESAAALEREIDYQDRFAPEPPERVVALSDGGRVRLVLESSTAPGVVGYVVYRQDPGAEFHRVNADPAPGLEFLDTGLVVGLTYLYRVTAVDQAGNEGVTSDTVSVTVR